MLIFIKRIFIRIILSSLVIDSWFVFIIQKIFEIRFSLIVFDKFFSNWIIVIMTTLSAFVTIVNKMSTISTVILTSSLSTLDKLFFVAFVSIWKTYFVYSLKSCKFCEFSLSQRRNNVARNAKKIQQKNKLNFHLNYNNQNLIKNFCKFSKKTQKNLKKLI